MEKGYRIWEIEKNLVPKEIKSGKDIGNKSEFLKELDLDNKTYAIRIGIGGLK